MKSDDVVGRVKTYEAIIKGENIPKAGIPESFKVLIKELQSLAMDISVLDENGNEVELKENLDDTDLNLHRLIEGDRRYRDQDRREFADYGYATQEFNDKGELEDSADADLELADTTDEEPDFDSDDFSDEN